MTARGEAVPCNTCKVLLFASPDDDHGDPKPGKPLDESVHYRFARPAGYVEAPKVKRISSAPIVDQTWVVIQTWVRSLNGRDYPLAGQEGRVIKIGDMAVVDSGIVPAALVAINGNEGLAGSHEIGGNLEWIPLSKLRAMILPTLRTSDPVRIISGQHKGVEGIVHASYLGEVHVAVEQGGYRVLIVPIEAVEKLEPLEITAVTKETDTTKDPAHV